ncbi:YicC family protein [bacterium]|nr:YicC family protein [bacterium]
MSMKSMTGFGQASVSGEDGLIRAEIKAVNNRFLDISIRMPPGFMKYEAKIRELISQSVHRGKVDVFIAAPPSVTSTSRLVIDESLVKELVGTLRRLSEEHALSGKITPDTIAAFRPAFFIETTPDAPDVWDLLQVCMSESLERFEEMRNREGLALQGKILEEIAGLKKDAKQLETELAGRELHIRDRLLEFVRTQCNIPEVDSDRLEQEVALLLVKHDISEENVRLWSHLDQFSLLSEQDSPKGKQLNFISQELLREVNTIASKTQSKEISSLTIKMKSRIEIIREQLNNIE